MRKKISLLLGLLMVFIFVASGCGSSDDDTSIKENDLSSAVIATDYTVYRNTGLIFIANTNVNETSTVLKWDPARFTFSQACNTTTNQDVFTTDDESITYFSPIYINTTEGVSATVTSIKKDDTDLTKDLSTEVGSENYAKCPCIVFDEAGVYEAVLSLETEGGQKEDITFTVNVKDGSLFEYVDQAEAASEVFAGSSSTWDQYMAKAGLKENPIYPNIMVNPSSKELALEIQKSISALNGTAYTKAAELGNQIHRLRAWKGLPALTDEAVAAAGADSDYAEFAN